MRRHDARKWLHAILDLLPVILIPVFMIYSHRHTIDSYSIDVPQNKAADFNQLANILLPNDSYGLTFVKDYNGYLKIDGTSDSANDKILVSNLKSDHIYLIKSSVELPIGFSLGRPYNPSNRQYYRGLPQYDYYSYISFSASSTIDNFETYINLFDLTQMFGSGNEPSVEQFNNWFTESHYDYVLSKKVLIKDYNTITYDDTDIMSQFTYNLYNSVDKYFNMNNVFGLNSVYDWFNLNIFNGNAPLYIYIIWNIVLYEFVMDLLMLLYALFMWFIDFCQDLIDRCFTTSKGGKH